MLVIPAIDLRGGRVVRLRRGDYAAETAYADDPAAVALAFAAAGARLIHVVDLDGARDGRPVNLAALRRIGEAVDAGGPPGETRPAGTSVIGGANCSVQFGGGLRDDEAIATATAGGAGRLVLGSAAVADPAWVEAVARRLPGRVLVSLDARDGRLAVHGWRETTRTNVLDVAGRLMDRGVAEFVYTDINRDGTGDGPDLRGVEALAALGCSVIASGGVGSLEDLRRLAAAGAAGAIVGRALYEGSVDLREAIETLSGGHDPCSANG